MTSHERDPAPPGWRAAVDAGDLDELLRWVDRLADAGAWPELEALAAAARAAHERGRQLWPAATHAHHRLALEAPAPAAVRALDGDDRFGPGPLTEVIADRHTLGELVPHLRPGPAATLVVHERALRGDDPADPGPVADLVVDVFDIPAEQAAWEPAWPVATYDTHGVDAPRPDRPAGSATPVTTRRGERVDDPDTVEALVGAVRHWVTDSNGRAEAVVVAGGVVDAVGALGPRRVRLVEADPATALAHLAWAAASGGAHGRRRGAAWGRFEAWWVAAAVTDTAWPPDPAELGAAVARARWWLWDADEPDTGWSLRLAGELPGEGLAWAFA
ncbi:MAG: hypothetical protein D6683_16695, partial [Actinomyces sp.]